MLSYPLTNFKIQKYFQNGPKFNGVYSRNNLPKIRDGEYIIKLDEYESVGNHWIAPYVNDGNGNATCDATYFDSYGKQKSRNKYL